MLEFIFLFLFSSTILLFSFLNLPLLLSLLVGYVLFFIYGLIREYTFSNMLSFSISGVVTARNVMLQLVIIGAMTGLWRAIGTISYIVYSTYSLATPRTIILSTYLLCALVSTLIGSSMGTSATMGVICATTAMSMGLSPALVGGAVLSGCAVGDRCSPVSGPATLISSITKTDIYTFCRMMTRTALLPFILTGAIYYFLTGTAVHESSSDLMKVFSSYYRMNLWMLFPAAVLVLLIICRLKVRHAMLVSVAASILVGLFNHSLNFKEIFSIIIFGFHPEDENLARLISGGGIISMSKIIGIILISSTYSGIFRGTGFLHGIKEHVAKLSSVTNSFFATLVTAIATSALACNQTLAVMLTNDVVSELVVDNEKRAIYLSDSAILISALIPWSIAGTAVLLFVGAPLNGLLFSFYNYLLPLCTLFFSFFGDRIFNSYIGKKLS